ncbi:heme peroxidase [Apiospora arundinis]
MSAAAFSRQVARSALRTSTRNTFSTSTRHAFRQSGRRFYSSEPPKPSSGSGPALGALAGLAVVGGGYYFYQSQNGSPKVFNPTKEDYQKVYNEIAGRLEEKDDYDDGSYGPVLVRLAWHASGTYDKETKTGGSNGATMRFAPEGDHGANAGLKHARDFLEPVKVPLDHILGSLDSCRCLRHPGDAGPVVPWRPGRADKEAAACTPDGRLPDAAQGTKHLRDIFYRMGFNDQEIVALAGAHALGRCHTDRSGFDGPWTFSPTVLTNDYYTLLLDEKWHIRKWDGPKQYEDKTKGLMMLPADYALIEDKAMKPWVQKYAKDNDLFFKDFSEVVVKLFELGVPFKEGSERMTFKPTNA